MSRCLVVLLLDAFRPDYLVYTHFLKYLAITGTQGCLIEPFGFCPRAAYFGGISPEEVGYSNIYWYDPTNSPFRSVNYLASSHIRPSYEQLLRDEITRHIRMNVTDYAATYINTASIPLQYLHYFDVTEKCAPFDSNIGYESIFSLLDKMEMPWYASFWPLTNKLPRASDEEILGIAMKKLHHAHRFVFIHLMSLDSIGHNSGPSSNEIISAIKKIDHQVNFLIKYCHLLFNRVDVLIFGDHGMVDVTQTINLDAKLNKSSLAYGNDYVAFYDSTMARFWCSNRYTRDKLIKSLESIEEGRILSEVDKVKWKISQCDPRNGEIYFLAHPGTIIFPNFFQASGIVNGMHGYAPEAYDNKGIFILNDGHSKGTVGDVQATQLFHTMKDLLGLPVSAEKGFSVRSQICSIPNDIPRYTNVLRRDEESIIDKHLEIICQKLCDLDPWRDAIVLCGGFGRGEGSIRREHNYIIPLNDYDVMLITRSLVERNTLKELGQQIASEFGIDFIDIGLLNTSILQNLAPTQLMFDLKYGSQVLDGDPTILEYIPCFGARAIPSTEAVKLLFNRLAGILLALPDYDLLQIANKFERFLVFQVAKMWIAVGDAHLLLWGSYDVSYLVRRNRFVDLWQSGKIDKTVANIVLAGYDFKVGLGDISTNNLNFFLSLIFSEIPLILTKIVSVTHGILIELPVSFYDTLKVWIKHSKDKQEHDLRSVWAAISVLIVSHIADKRNTCLQQAAIWLSANKQSTYEELRQTALSLWEEKCH